MSTSKSLEYQHLPQYQQELILTLKNYILQNIHQSDLKISDLAFTVGMSERQLFRKTKAVLQMTPNSFINTVRLELAKDILEKGVYSTISECAYAVGYRSPDYFSKLFYKKYAKRPNEYFLNQN